MSQTMVTTFILGAGFSIPAGYPSGHSLNEKFFKKLENHILKFSDGQWAWDEYDNATAHNGRINTDYLNISLLLSELIESFQQGTFFPFDYEEFFDWIYRKYDSSLIKRCCDNVNKRILDLNMPASSSHLFINPGINEYSKIQECYSYLIADLLKRPYKRVENLNLYSEFVDCLKKDQKVNVFTLNHDTLFEFLMKTYKLDYSDGFSTENSRMVNNQNEPLEIFIGEYNSSITLHKLHGSVDYYQFAEMVQSENGFYNYTGKYWLFKPKSYWDIHMARLVDDSTTEVIQSINPDIKPQFLTGKSKLNIINDHLIFKQLYTNLEKSLANTNKLIIIGYSYRDKHINQVIKKSLQTTEYEIVNVNPTVSFPFRRNFSLKNIKQLNSMNEL